MTFEHLFENSRGGVNLATIIQYARAKSFEQGVIRFQLGPLIEFGQSLFITALVHEDASPMETGHYTFIWIEPHHTFETTQRPLVISIEAGQIAAREMNPNVVGILFPQQVNFG